MPVPTPELQMKLLAARAAAVSGKGSPRIYFCLLMRSLSRFRGDWGAWSITIRGTARYPCVSPWLLPCGDKPSLQPSVLPLVMLKATRQAPSE